MSLAKSLKWIAISQIFKIAAQLVSIFYLTTLIAPKEYGLLAMVAVVINFATIFSDLGTGGAILQKQKISQDFYNFIYRINIITGFVVMLAIVLLSPVIVSYFQEQKLYRILFLFSIIFPMIALSITYKSHFEKNQNFKFLAKIEVISSLIGLLLAIILANLNFGVYSLVIQTIMSWFLFTVMVVYCSDLKLSFKAKIDNKEVSGVIGFSGNIFLFNLINYFSRNIDTILIGRFFSSAVLGVYSVACRIMLFPVQSLTFVVARAFLPHLTKDLGNLERNKQDYLSCVFMILTLSAPLMFGLSAVSKEFVAIFFNEKWSLLANLLIWMAPTAVIQSFLSTYGTIFTAYAKTHWLFGLGCLDAVLMITTFLVGIHFDIQTLTKLYFFANLVYFFPVVFLLMKILHFSFFEIFKVLFKTIFPAFLMYLGVVYFSHYLLFASIETLFLLKILWGVAIYIVLYSLFNRSVVCVVLKQLKARFLK